MKSAKEVTNYTDVTKQKKITKFEDAIVENPYLESSWGDYELFILAASLLLKRRT